MRSLVSQHLLCAESLVAFDNTQSNVILNNDLQYVLRDCQLMWFYWKIVFHFTHEHSMYKTLMCTHRINCEYAGCVCYMWAYESRPMHCM